MSIEICTGAEIAENGEPRVHWLPAQIDAPNGVHQSRADQYFQPQIQQTDQGRLTASFRGRLLNGETFSFPDEYKCFVIDETRKPLSEDANRKLYVSSKFSKMTYWNWDQKTSSNDSFKRMLDWIDIAENLHKPADRSE